MQNLLEYSDWNAIQQKIGQTVIVGDEQGQILSYDSDRKVWMVRFVSGVKPVSAEDIREIDDTKGGPFGGVYKQTSAPTLSI
jgi:hypothetical protein